MLDENGKVSFSEAEQAEVNRVISERLAREGVQDSKEIVELLKEFDYSGTPSEVKAALKIQAESYKTQKAEQTKQAEIEALREQAQSAGTSPELLAEMKALKAEMAELKAERQAKKTEIENKTKADTEWAKQIDEFTKDYPDVNLDELNENTKFIKFCKGKKGVPLKELYEDYTEIVGETAEEATKKATSKIERSTGGGKGNSDMSILTPEQRELLEEWNASSPAKITPKQFLEKLRK